MLFAKTRKNINVVSACLILGVSASNSFSQSVVLEEILVTASKRGEANIQDLAFSVQALDADKLNEIGALDFNDFFRQVSGLSVLDPGPGDKRYVIRGVNATGAGTVGLYLDEAIITGENAQDGVGRQPDIKLFDMERVEFLKGPQGTTFGSSSLSGTIRYITNKPNLQQMELDTSASLRSTKGADIGGQIEVAGNLPLIENKLAIRAAGILVRKEGYIDNPFDQGANNDETEAFRVSAKWAITDGLNLNLMYMNQDMQSDSLGHYYLQDFNGTPLPEFTGQSVTRTPFFDDLDILSGNLEYKTDYGSFLATASRVDRDVVYNRDASLNLFVLIPAVFTSLTGNARSVITQPKDRRVDSYEFRFASDWESPLQALAGVFYQEEERFFQSRIFPTDPTGRTFSEVAGYSLDRNVRTKIDETAVFAELSYDITGKLNLTGGLRWFENDVKEVATAVTGVTGGPGRGVGPQLAFGENNVIGKVNLSYDFTDDVMAYAQWSQGFRSGGTNDQTAAALANVVIPAGFGSDSLENYELGLKGVFFDTVVANASAYYIDWSDIQVQDQAIGPTGQFPFRGNGGGAEIYGLELDTSARVSEFLELSAVINMTSAELSADNPNRASGIKGDSIPHVPEFTASVSALYERPIALSGRDLTGFLGGDVFHVGSRGTQLRPNNVAYRDLEAYQLLNLRGGMRGDHWSASLSVNNVFNDDTVINVFDQVIGLYPQGLIVNQPRTVVLNVSKSFSSR